MRVKLSVVIITFNEEKNIGRCLKSVVDIADEIIVVDSGSTDNTENLCKPYNVLFYKTKWLGYSETKNYANSLANNDLIFSIDADEALSDELKKSIIEIKANYLANTYYSVSRLTNYCGKWIKHCGWYPDRKIRIFNKNFCRWNDFQVHEKLEFIGDYEIMLLKGDLYHFSYYTISEHIDRINKYSGLIAAQMHLKNKKVKFYNLMFSYMWRFTRDYFFKLGFLDGYYGFIICKISANHAFLKHSKLYELNRNKKYENAE